MPIPQTSYGYTMAAAIAGMIAETMAAQYVRSALQGEAAAEIPFGVGVAQGTLDNQVILPSGGAAKIVGVALFSNSYSKDLDLGTTGLKPKATVSVMEKGRCWVVVEQAVAKEDPVYIRHTPNGAGKLQLGAFRKDADTANALQMKGCRYLTTQATPGGLAMVEVDFNVARTT